MRGDEKVDIYCAKKNYGAIDDLFSSPCMEYAVDKSQSSNCLSRKVGAVIVDQGEMNVLISYGFNSTIHHQPPCNICKRIIDDKGTRMSPGDAINVCTAIHAEQLAICNAAKHGRSVNGCVMYVTTEPCSTCAKLIIAAGITKVYYLQPYDGEGIKLLEKAKVIVRKVEFKFKPHTT